MSEPRFHKLEAKNLDLLRLSKNELLAKGTKAAKAELERREENKRRKREAIAKAKTKGGSK